MFIANARYANFRLKAVLRTLHGIGKDVRLMSARKQTILGFSLVAVGLLVLLGPSRMVASEPIAKNSWRGITPLRSSVEDVARAIGADLESGDAMLSGPYKVEGGEVTFSYLTPSIAKIYRAPKSLVGKVFTIYFKPGETMSRADLALGPGFKRCVEENDRTIYYFVSDAGVAYRLRRDSDQLETVIYQPSRVEVRSLAVVTECVF
jgi:hypothetical protein